MRAIIALFLPNEGFSKRNEEKFGLIATAQ